MQRIVRSFVIVVTFAVGACGPKPAPEPPVTSGPGPGAGLCPVEACGPAIGMPNSPCSDGVTIAGPSGRCLKQADASCGWEVVSCPAEAGDAKGCAPTGCSGTVCAELGEEIMTTCEYLPEYECYKSAKCERQGGGSCGWTPSEALQACLGAKQQ